MIELKDYSKGSWVYVTDPDKEEIDFLVKEFDLDKDLILDGLDIFEIPRLEVEKNSSYIYLRIPTNNIENEHTASFLVIVKENLVITICDSKIELFDRLFKTKKNFFTYHGGRDFLNILFILSSKYSYWIRMISKEVKKERRNLEKLKSRDILKLSLQEDILNDYLSSLEPLRDLNNALVRSKHLNFQDDEKDFILDLNIDIDQTISLCKSSLKSITNMRDYYSTILSNTQNQILKTLTIFTVFLTIPMIMTGLFGMNVHLPFQDDSNAFIMVIFTTMLIMTIAYLFLKKTKIL
jgi:Mg2+ and Co2+ transporter CorA